MSLSHERAQVKNIWIVQTGFVGDVVLTLPLVHEAAVFYPEARITLITTKAGVELLERAKTGGLKNFSTRVSAEHFKKKDQHRGFFKLLRWVRDLAKPKAPDVVFCVQRSLRTGLLAYLSGAKVRIGFSSGAATLFYTSLVPREWEGNRSEIEKNLDLLRALVPEVAGWSPDQAPSLFCGANSDSKSTEPAGFANPFLREPSGPIAQNANNFGRQEINTEINKGLRVGISIGSPWATKMWPLEENIELAKKLTLAGVEVVLLGDQGASLLGEKIKNSIPSLLLQNRIGETTVAEWVEEISKLDVLVSGDSAAVHVASDLKIPVVALFGPTIPEFGFAPWRKNSVVLQIRGLDCRPCDIHGPKVCPKGHHRCLKDMAPHRVFSFVERLLGGSLSN